MPSQAFFKACPELKKNEQWQDIIDLGKIVLLKKDLQAEKAALICIEIATCFYYIGDYNASLITTNTSFQYCDEIKDDVENNITTQNLRATGYCLLAADYRMLALTCLENQDEHTRISLHTIKLLFQFDAYHLDLELDGKIKLNLGISAHTLRKNYNAAEKLYAQAIDLFERAISIESTAELIGYLHIAKICFINLLLDSNKASAKECLKYAEELNSKINYGSRSWVQFLILKTKIMINLKNNEQASQYAHEAFERAHSKNMQTEATQMSILLNQIETHDLTAKKPSLTRRSRCTIS